MSDHSSGYRSHSQPGYAGSHRRGRHRAPRSFPALIFPGLPLAALLAFGFALPAPAARIAALPAARAIAAAPARQLSPAVQAQAAVPDTILGPVKRHAPAAHRRHPAPAAPSASLAASRIPRPPRAHPPPAVPAQAPAAAAGSFEACVIARESGGNPQAYNASSGAGGLFQFLPSTWASLGYAGAYPGGAQTAPASVQEQAFARLYAEAGTSPWAPYDGC